MENNSETHDASSYLFVGCLFLGMAVGAFLEDPGVGLMGGMGVGFIISSIYRTEKK